MSSIMRNVSPVFREVEKKEKKDKKKDKRKQAARLLATENANRVAELGGRTLTENQTGGSVLGGRPGAATSTLLGG